MYVFNAVRGRSRVSVTFKAINGLQGDPLLAASAPMYITA